ncbi:hypothetical protein VSDG_01963 [Cytospora chrysosperma]|uniref:Uncharacterized protein n=1 Tax=Cytospora chrysosperma TaxID=252740 RepID=A0A423WHZ5_CYTCH|nr:hypothetical protein VSDG_01963 [Valsa sordida]
MVGASDIDNLLATGTWSTQRTKSPKSSNPVRANQSFKLDPLDPKTPRSIPHPSHRCSAFPPPPSVEDEVEAVAKEHDGSLVSVSDEEPKCRGDVDQQPLILPVSEHNVERRYVILTPSEADEDSLSDGSQVGRQPKPPQKMDYVANTKIHLDPKAEKDAQLKPQRRKSRAELPRIETHVPPTRPKTPTYVHRSSSATCVDQKQSEAPDYFSPHPESARPAGDAFLSPVIKHATKGRDRAYWNFSTGASGTSPRGSATDLSKPDSGDRKGSDGHAKSAYSPSPAAHQRRTKSALEPWAPVASLGTKTITIKIEAEGTLPSEISSRAFEAEPSEVKSQKTLVSTSGGRYWKVYGDPGRSTFAAKLSTSLDQVKIPAPFTTALAESLFPDSKPQVQHECNQADTCLSVCIRLYATDHGNPDKKPQKTNDATISSKFAAGLYGRGPPPETSPAAGATPPYPSTECNQSGTVNIARYVLPEVFRGYWLTLPRSENFNICPSCYEQVFQQTEFRDLFIPAPFRTREREIACDLGTSPWYRIAWLMTRKYQRSDLRLLQGVADVLTREKIPCYGDVRVSRIWYSITDPDTRRCIPDFQVCSPCAKAVEVLFPSLMGIFVPLDRPAEPKSGKCSLHFTPSRKRFLTYFDVFEKCHDRAMEERSAPDSKRLAYNVNFWANVEECPREKPLRQEYWYTMADIPEMTVCEECFLDVVYPELVADVAARTAASGEDRVNSVARNFYRKPHHIKSATVCQMASPWMRQLFRSACRRENGIWYMDEKIRETLESP